MTNGWKNRASDHGKAVPAGAFLLYVKGFTLAFNLTKNQFDFSQPFIFFFIHEGVLKTSSFPKPRTHR